MNPEQPHTQPDPNLQNVDNPLSAMREGEQVLCEIKRHPIGIIGVYVSAALILLIVVAAAVLLPSHMSNLTSQDKAGLLFGALIISVITLLYTYVAHVVYTGNRWILTDDSLTQVTQTGLFRKHSSQLSLANLEDITADQNGLVQSLFGFGDLRAETAGERSKFVFPYCPKPNDYARKILNAREAFIMNNPEEAKRANDLLQVPHYAANAPAQSAPQAPQIDPQQYQEFLAYQQMVARQQQAEAATAQLQPEPIQPAGEGEQAPPDGPQ